MSCAESPEGLLQDGTAKGCDDATPGNIIEKVLGKALPLVGDGRRVWGTGPLRGEKALSKLRNLFMDVEPVRGTALLPGDVPRLEASHVRPLAFEPFRHPKRSC